MTSLHRIPNPAQVEEEASTWIARLNADDVAPMDRARFEGWRAAHPAHARAFEELSATWTEFTNAGPWVRAVSFAQSMNELAAMPTHRSALRSPRALRTAVAAAMLITLCALGALYLKPWASSDRYTTAIGDHATIALQDGSKLELNSDSAATVSYFKDARIIHLTRGEGYFQVAHDPSRPFWVVGGHSWVRAVGTAFNVYLRPDAVQVTVTEGTVKVGSTKLLQGADPTDLAIATTPVAVLKAGEQADLRGTATDTRRLTAVEVQRAENWREGTVYFENQPLSAVVAELNRYTTTRVMIEDERLRQLSVGGTFETTPKGVESLLTMLEQGFGVRVTREGNSVLIENGGER